ncbi:hypothetical protein D3C75_904810 [compost metagenome]
MEAVAPDAGGLGGAAEVRFLQPELRHSGVTQLQAALHRGGRHQLQLGMGAGRDEAAVRLDHHVAAIPQQPLLGHQGTGQRHARRRFDGVEMYAGEAGHVRVLVL